MKTTEDIISQMAIAYDKAGAGWVKVTDIAKTAGLTAEEIAEGIRELMGADEFRAEPQPFAHRITAEDEIYAPVIGGEARHLISWE